MNNTMILPIGGMVIAVLSLITTFILQLDKKRIRDTESENKKLKNHLAEALKAVEGYHLIETHFAQKDEISVDNYRKKIRREASATDCVFLKPSRLKDFKSDLL